MSRLVVPALGIDRVWAKNLQFPSIDFPGEHPDHAPVFILEKFPHRSGEDQQGSARLSKYQHLHLAMQFLAVPLVIFTIHEPKYLT